MIRFSQLVASSTARWLRDTMRTMRATAATVTATIVLMATSCPYTSCMMLENLSQIVPPDAAKTGVPMSTSEHIAVMDDQ